MDDSPDLDFHLWAFVLFTDHIRPHFWAGTWPIASISISLTILLELPPTVTSCSSESHALSLKKLMIGLSAPTGVHKTSPMYEIPDRFDRAARFPHEYPNLTSYILQTDHFFELSQNDDFENMPSLIFDSMGLQ
jgi:hypothetical protein